MDALRLVRIVPIAALIVVSAMAAWQSAEYSWTAFLAKADPARALAAAPDSGAAIVAQVTAKIESNPGYVPGRLEAKSALASLRDRPLNEGALRILASVRERDGDESKAAELMRLSDRVSRRDVLAQLWLIENAVRLDNVSGAIEHYHNALSLRAELGPVLFPILSAALPHEEVRRALQPYIRNGVAWVPAFLTITAANSPTQAISSVLGTNAAYLSDASFDRAKATMIHRLLLEGSSSATTLASAFWPGLGASAYKSFGMSAASRDGRTGRLAWDLPQTEGVTSSIESDGMVTASIAPLARGVLVERDFPVTPGQSYHLSNSFRQTERSAPATLRWIVACVYADRLETVASEGSLTNQSAAASAMDITIPAGCNLARFSLAVQGPDSQTPAGVVASGFTLTRR